MTTTLSPTDTIYATVTMHARTIVKLTLSGFSSMSDLMQNICGRLGGVAGLVTVEMRNGTSGWLEKKALRLGGRREVNVPPVQLTLF